MNKDMAELTPFLDSNGRLTQLPAKRRKKLMALWYLAGKIEPGRKYSEAEINDIINQWTLFNDPATIRRELYKTMLLNRSADCSLYQKPEDIPELDSFIARRI